MFVNQNKWSYSAARSSLTKIFSSAKPNILHLRQISKHPHVQCSALKLVIYKFLQSIVILFQKIKTLC